MPEVKDGKKGWQGQKVGILSRATIAVDSKHIRQRSQTFA